MGFTAFNPSYRVETMKPSIWNPCRKMLWVPSLQNQSVFWASKTKPSKHG
jgi:hypothetical protein